MLHVGSHSSYFGRDFTQKKITVESHFSTFGRFWLTKTGVVDRHCRISVLYRTGPQDLQVWHQALGLTAIYIWFMFRSKISRISDVGEITFHKLRRVRIGFRSSINMCVSLLTIILPVCICIMYGNGVVAGNGAFM